MKALVLLSGGVDSATCLALAVDKYGAKEVMALSVFYGQTHNKELQAAQKIADFYKVPLKKLDLSVIFEGSDCSLLQGSPRDIPLQSYAEQIANTGGKPVSTYVPFRNGLFISAAASVALSHGCEVIYYG
ncbi:MAG: 7-cyano-7-deazaguanine synthase, partial [Clostridia bacterium]|nr:7-cyano-7-deazaguanine synthase [Clostridia bacterium]